MRVALLAALISTPALAAPPPGMSAAAFQAVRVQNMRERANGRGATCPPVRKVMCRAVPVPVLQPDDPFFKADRSKYSCDFDERVAGKWRARKDMILARFDREWDFNGRALAACSLK